jgi:hypothetical protein
MAWLAGITRHSKRCGAGSAERELQQLTTDHDSTACSEPVEEELVEV